MLWNRIKWNERRLNGPRACDNIVLRIRNGTQVFSIHSIFLPALLTFVQKDKICEYMRLAITTQRN